MELQIADLKKNAVHSTDKIIHQKFRHNSDYAIKMRRIAKTLILNPNSTNPNPYGLCGPVYIQSGIF